MAYTPESRISKEGSGMILVLLQQQLLPVVGTLIMGLYTTVALNLGD